MPDAKEPNDPSNIPESQPAASAEVEADDGEPLSSLTIDDITIDVVIPGYEPLDVPYSEWETHRSQELLAANGFANTVDEWRRAAQHSTGLIRETGYYLLTRQPVQQDEVLYRHGLSDTDESVQTLSAYGLYMLGDESALPVLESIAQLDVNAHSAATRAAGILAESGDPTAFATIQKALSSELSHIRLFAIQNCMPFAALDGQNYAPGKTIDIWNLYRKALRDDVDEVRNVARLQLRELNSPESLALIDP